MPAAASCLPDVAWFVLRAVGVVWLLGCASVVQAHEFTLDAVMNAFVKVDRNELHLVIRAPLYLFKSAKFPINGAHIDIEHAGAATERALAGLQQGVTIFEDGRALKAVSAIGRLALPSDRSFEGYELAAAHVAAPVDPDTRIVVDQGYVDAHLVYPVVAPNGVLSIRTAVAPELGDYLKLTLRYIASDANGRAMVIRGGSGIVDLNPTRWGAATGFIGLGIGHIVTGYDHLLFLLCLVIPLRGLRQLLTIVTAFTLAHSFTLIGSAFGLAPQGAWFAPFIEMLIAISIVYTALENIVSVHLPRRVVLSMLFGLAHGFAFSQGLREELQFAGSHLLVSLFAFNVGIEIGQILALALMLPALVFATSHVLPGRVGSIILAALIAHVGWHWMVERWDTLSKVKWPSPDLANLIVLMFWIGGLALLMSAVLVAVTRLRLEPVRPMHGPGDAG